MVQIAIPYAYGCTICVYIRVWYVPYAYGMKYAYDTQQLHLRTLRRENRYYTLAGVLQKQG